jgi:hypothetical protein
MVNIYHELVPGTWRPIVRTGGSRSRNTRVRSSFTAVTTFPTVTTQESASWHQDPASSPSSAAP